MVELNEKGLEAAEVTWRASVSATCKLMLRDAIRAYLSALSAPDDGLVERLRKSADGLAQRQSEWVEHALAIPADGEALEAAGLLREAATALQSQDEQIERLTEERDAAQAEAKKWWLECCQALQDKNAAETAEQQVQKLTTENERLREALTPSGETKAAYMGEFHMGITLSAGEEEEYRRVMIPWVTIKEIMAAIRARAAIETQESEE